MHKNSQTESGKKRVLVVGAGFLGGCLARELEKDHLVTMTHCHHKASKKTVKFDFFLDEVGKVFGKNKFDIVVLAAKIEFEQDRALLEKSMEKFVEFFQERYVIYLSSDGIFDGKRGGYKENDIPMPVTLYGKNLLLCESLIKKRCKKYCIVRPSYIYGHAQERLDARLYQAKTDLENGLEVEKFSDMYKSPLDVNQTAYAIAQLARKRYQGIMHVAGRRVSVYEFFKESLTSLGVATQNLVAVKMPLERPIDFLPDTSLDSSPMKKFLKEM